MAIYFADSVNGNDSYDGSETRPKLTAQAAINLCTNPGDTVKLDGVFREVITSVPSGLGTGINSLQQTIAVILGTFTFDRLGIPVTITSKDSVSPAELTSFKVVTAWGAVDGNGNYKSTATHRNPMFIRINGQYAKHGDSLTTLAPGEWYFENTGSYTGYVYINVDPATTVIEIPDNRTAFEATGVNALHIDNIKYTGNRESSTAGMRFINCTNILVTNVDFSGCWKALDFRGTSNNCVAAFNTVTYCGDGLDANEINTDRPSNILFYGNYCEGLYKDLNSVSWLANALTTGTVPVDHEGIAWTKTGDNIHAVGNTCKWWYDNISIYSGTVGVSNWNVLGNTLLESRDDGLQVAAQASMTIASLKVIGNLFIRNGMHDNLADRVNNWAAAIPSSVNNVEYCNNTMVDNSNGYLCSAVAGKCLNNIFVNHGANDGSGGAAGYHINFSGAATIGNHEIDYNRYYLKGGFRTGATYYTLTQFSNYKTASGKDTNSLQTNPNLDANYIPQDSVCRGAGTKYWLNGARPTSINVEPLPDEGIDIGAYQTTSHPFHPVNL